ncbi:DENN domain-containing protein 1B isoform X2 [Scleropages formosus]|uniref:DENN domain-containing protein 1B isoform X2 n=1 Tax=Scleropages formosus TaxID=113540 RepID=UPI0010FA94DA|nr:DENN domain-containing protein 1B-like isoform X2 [Scleropages formosus]
MGTRLKQNPERTFYWFFEASCPIAKDKDPGVLFQFPEDFSDEESIQSLPRFCFPYDIERVRASVAVQHFTFVLTDLEGCQRFGFCRQTSGSRTCLCILSYLPWFEVFYKLLNSLADYLSKGQTNEMRELLSALYRHPVPQADSCVTLQLGEQIQITTGARQPPDSGHPAPLGQGESGIPYFIAPDPRTLPSIPESRNLTELVVAVDVSNLLQLYASMLFERRILICSSKLSTCLKSADWPSCTVSSQLTACVHACSAMLFPMYWQHIFIPVLPPHLLDYCCAPMPYLIGVHSSLFERVRGNALEDVVILNVDTNTIESPFDDLKRIPSDVVSALKMRLKKQSAATGTGVARAFLRAQAQLFGGYRDALICTQEGGSISFCKESFLNHKSSSMRQFLESAVHLQFFKQFIDARLELLNRGSEPADLFEEEILQFGASACGRPYQQWVGSLKKGGGALIHTVKTKANIYKAGKILAKCDPRNKEDSDVPILYRVGSLRSDPPGSHQYRRVRSDCLQSRLPITQHFGKSRPRRPTRRFTSPLEDGIQSNPNSTATCTWEPVVENGEADAEVSSMESTQLEDPDSDLMPDPEEMDLLGEIFDTLSTRSSHERGLLYATRSLDLFGSDSSDYITRCKMTAPSQESLSPSTGRSESLLSWGQDGSLEESQHGDLEEGGSDRLDALEVGQQDSFREGIEECVEENSKAGKGKGCYEDRQEEGLERLEQEPEGLDRTRLERHDMGFESSQVVQEEEQRSENVESFLPDSSPALGGSALLSPSTGVAWEKGTHLEDQLAVGPPSGVEEIAVLLLQEGSMRKENQSQLPQQGNEGGDTPKTNSASPEILKPGSAAVEGESTSPRLKETLTLFEVRASRRPVSVWRNISERPDPSVSPNGRLENRATGVLDSSNGVLCTGLSAAPETSETEDHPPVKVSELKKRFEA